MWLLSLVFAKSNCFLSEYGTKHEADSSGGDGFFLTATCWDDTISQCGQYGCVKPYPQRSPWLPTWMQTKAQKSGAMRFLYGTYPDNLCILKILLDLPKVSRILLVSVKSLGVARGTPVWKTNLGALISFLHSIHIPPSLPSCPGPGHRQEGHRDDRESVSGLGDEIVQWDNYLSAIIAICRGS